MSYLKTLRLEYNTDGGLPHFERLPTEPKERQRQLAYIRSISSVIDRMKILWVFFDYALHEAKIKMLNPPVTSVWLTLSRCPETDLKVHKKNLSIDLDYDPAKLIDIPHTPEALGEFALGCWEQALKKLEEETDFPATFIREQMDKFRKQGYAMSNSLKSEKIEGSKAKARIHGIVSCARTVLKVEVAYRKNVLFERTIWNTAEQAFDVAYTKREFVVENKHFKVHEACLGLLPEATFPLDSLPESFSKTLT